MIKIICHIPILVTLLEIVIDVSAEHELKALCPILVTLLGIVIDVSDEHELKEP